MKERPFRASYMTEPSDPGQVTALGVGVIVVDENEVVVMVTLVVEMELEVVDKMLEMLETLELPETLDEDEVVVNDEEVEVDTEAAVVVDLLDDKLGEELDVDDVPIKQLEGVAVTVIYTGT